LQKYCNCIRLAPLVDQTANVQCQSDDYCIVMEENETERWTLISPCLPGDPYFQG
jgi:hypothetical protein